MTVASVGQRSLFGGLGVVGQPTRFTVSVFGCRRPWSTAFALVLGEARGVALAGQRAVILATDGTSVEVTVSPDGGVIIDPGVFTPPPWADQVRRLLGEHG